MSGELESARKVYELWAQTYPRDIVPLFNLGDIYFQLGEYGKALTARQEPLKIEPGGGSLYSTLVGTYLALNRRMRPKPVRRRRTPTSSTPRGFA